jgi:hypothetical protein
MDMCFLRSCWGKAQALGGDHLGGVYQHQLGAPLIGLETTPLGRAQALLGELEVGQVLQCLARPGEPGLDPCGKCTDRRGAASLGTHRAKGGIEEITPVGRALGQPVGAEQRLGLVALELVALHRLGHGLLLLGAERAERVGQGHPEPALVDLSLQRLAELLGQGETLVDPARIAATDLGDGLWPLLLLVAQSEDHAGLVHGRERARRPVGLEQSDQPARPGARCLHEHRHALQTELAPAPEALEAVDDLVDAALAGHHPQRQRSERGLVSAPGLPPAAKPFVARAERARRDPLDPWAALRLGRRRALQRGFRARGDHGSSPETRRAGTGPPGGTASTWRKPSIACA